MQFVYPRSIISIAQWGYRFGVTCTVLKSIMLSFKIMALMASTIISGAVAATHLIPTQGLTGNGSIVLSNSNFEAMDFMVKKFFRDRDHVLLPCSTGAVSNDSIAYAVGRNGGNAAC